MREVKDYRKHGMTMLTTKALGDRMDARIYEIGLGKSMVLAIPKEMTAAERSELAVCLRAIGIGLEAFVDAA